MLVWQKSSPMRIVLAFAVPVSSFLLVGCGDDGGVSSKPPVASTTSAQSAADTRASDAAVMQQIEQENSPRVVSFPDPGKAESGEYLDAKLPMTAFNLYNSKRNWDETPNDIADSIVDAFKVRNANPELFRLVAQRQSEKDTFKQKDLTTAISVLVAEEAGKTKGSNLVKLSSDDWLPISLSPYDEQAKGFRIDNCLFSDKLEYTYLEKRSASSMSQSPLRCYLNPGPTSYYIGFQGGSDVLLDVSDEGLARKIEASRGTIKIDIYGYVRSIERERFAGEFGPQRYVLIGPQRIDVKDSTTGKVLYTKNI
ncbi:hypothetical protein [Pseudomonas sp.]|uniref:hypothetical protein n=1 Tax=Pseudomonas sp. TaxID=306 RepID=UPI0024880989|nr:hypothetical protein [Pseudomonas sp.]MDI1332416.1 hypothetical protein [Pseudomonas sp.]